MRASISWLRREDRKPFRMCHVTPISRASASSSAVSPRLNNRSPRPAAALIGVDDEGLRHHVMNSLFPCRKQNRQKRDAKSKYDTSTHADRTNAVRTVSRL